LISLFVAAPFLLPVPLPGLSTIFGFVIALAAVQILVPHSLVKPQMWKRQMGLTKAGKAASRELAVRLFPRAASQFKARQGSRSRRGRANRVVVAASPSPR